MCAMLAFDHEMIDVTEVAFDEYWTKLKELDAALSHKIDEEAGQRNPVKWV